MKKNEIDIQLLLNLIFGVPDNYDIDGIEFSNDNIRLITSYDYKKAREQQAQQKKEESQREFEKTLKAFVSACDKNFNKTEQSLLIEKKETPKKKRGRPRKIEYCKTK